jgi:hypothetical protein
MFQMLNFYIGFNQTGVELERGNQTVGFKIDSLLSIIFNIHHHHGTDLGRNETDVETDSTLGPVETDVEMESTLGPVETEGSTVETPIESEDV